MSVDAVCRLCLINNLNLYEVRNYIQIVYEGLTGEKYNKVGYPMSMCYICLSALRKCHKFMEAARDTENVLKQWYNNNQQMVLLAKPLSKYSVRTFPLISIDSVVDTSMIEVKIEPGAPPMKKCKVCEIQPQYLTPGPSKETAANNHYLHNLPQLPSNEVSLIQIKVEKPETEPTIDNDNDLAEIITSNKTVRINVRENKNMASVNDTLYQILYNKTIDVMNKPNTYTPNSKIEETMPQHLTTDTSRQTVANSETISDDIAPSQLENITIPHCPTAGQSSTPFPYIKDEETISTIDENNQSEDETTTVSEIVKINLTQRSKLVESVNDTLNQILNNKTIIVEKDINKTISYPLNTTANSALNTNNEQIGYNIGQYMYCELCNWKQVSIDDYSNHMRLHNITKPFVCNVCFLKFKSLSELINHKEKIHDSTEEYSCDRCNFKTKFEGALKHHNCKNKEELTCNLCNYKCKIKKTFQRHMQRHANPFSCDSCSYTTLEKYNLQYHVMSKHTNERPFTCDACGKKFVRDSDLRTHMKTHSGERPFTCDICGYKAVSKCVLRTHMRIHTGERPYTCDICGYRTKQSGALKEHMRRHAGIKPLSCDICGFKFLRRKALQRHIRSHTGEKPFSCDNCSYACASKSGLKRHVRTHTGDRPHSCSVCSYTCIQKGDLIIHMRKHTGEKPFSCDVCSYKCTQKNRLKRHMLTQHEISK